MIKPFAFGLLTASMMTLSSGVAFADYELNILHINDFHSRIESINKYDASCSAEEEGKNECFGGAARLKTAIDQRRAALSGKNVLVLNGGDNFQGSLFYTTFKGAAEADFVNAIGFDAMAVGNHEFDDGEDGFVGFLDKVKLPVLSANVLTGDSSKLKDRIKPYTVLDVGGQKIGIVSAVANDTEETSSPGPLVMISDDVSAIKAAVEELKEQNVNKIIALTHVGYVRDIDAIAAEIGKFPGRRYPDVDIAVSAMEAIQPRHQPFAGETVRRADIQRRVRVAARCGSRGYRQLIEHVADGARIRFADGSETHGPRGTLEELDAKLIFKVLDCPADGTMRDIELFRGPGEAQVPCGGLETR